MSVLFRSSAIASLALLAACATAGPGATLPRPTAAVSGESAYGLFLAGQEAINSGRGEAATDFFSRAADEAQPSDATLLRTRTFTAALLAGDVRQAAAIAPTADDDVSMRRLAELTEAVEDMAEDQGARARAILERRQAGGPHVAAEALLAPFAAAMAGDADASIAHPVIEGDPVAQFYASLDQGKLFEQARRYDEAETAFRALIARGDPGGIASLELGQMLERRGRWAEASATYDQALARLPGDVALTAAKARAARRRDAPPLPTLRASAAEALIGPASVLIIQKQTEVALAYLRLSLRLDPGRDTAWLLVGDILSEVGDASGARAAYLTPKAGSLDFVPARGKLAWLDQGQGDKDEALKIARETLAADPDSKDAATTLADLLRADEHYQESLSVLDKLIAGEGGAPDWRLLYMRAVDYQESDHWPEAEKDLTTALKQRPDEPELLNFLGYSWIDRGENLHQALAMVQKAVDANPKSGAMIDSLGWAYYRLGQYNAAVDKLEQAVAIEAGDPDVNNHLGDAYWRVGRQTEARFQWTRVLTLEPSDKLRAEVEAKLKNGLGPLNARLTGS
ncbi:MAG TPA: tetratricopeptide repeat protein [Caulobacteraceae bacterium]|jgi:Flp pilus assembly protein TadD|nr:tetratricopeptide repeat protein [Caulobacteraceae bacterium]